MPSCIVLGAGLQGACSALELAARGVDVTLVDQATRAMDRASLRNEGKVHLGLVYAADPSLRTADQMLAGALTFRPLLARWLGDGLHSLPLSTPFHYLVARDSIMNPDALEAHYAAVGQRCRRLLDRDTGLDYFGRRPATLHLRLPEAEVRARFGDNDIVWAGFETEELAVDTEVLGELLRDALAANGRIRFLPEHRVEAIQSREGGFRVKGRGAKGEAWLLEAEQVINATWESRMALDQGMGLEPRPGWVHRLKYRVIVRLPAALQGGPSATMVIGRYGDVVVRPDGTAYLSWYPEAMRGWSHDLRPPEAWGEACSGKVDPALIKELGGRFLEAIEPWYPGIAASQPLLADAGIIVANGATDVDDRDSRLHDRTEIGVSSVAGYHSVSTGKLTTAPLFAVQAADAVTGGGPDRFALLPQTEGKDDRLF
jgi:hypothetical protein